MYCLHPAVDLQKMMPPTLFWFFFFLNGKIQWKVPVSPILALSFDFVYGTCAHQLWHHQCCLYSGDPSVWAEFHRVHLIFRSVHLKKCCGPLDLILTVFVHPLLDQCVQLQSSYSSIWLCLCTNSRLCCMPFSWHWCKIHTVFPLLMQMTQRQCDPCVFLVILQGLVG